MAFCNADDVATFLGFEKFTDLTSPTKTQVENFIDIIYNRILWNFEKYVINVDIIKWADFLKYLNLIGASAIVLKTYISNPNGDIKYALQLDELFAKELTDFCFFYKIKKHEPDFHFSNGGGDDIV